MRDDSSSDYRMPVQRIAAAVTFTSGERRDVVLFCGPGEDLVDLIEAQEPFLPMDMGGKVRLFARRTIAVVSTPLPRDGFEDEATLMRHATVSIRLRGGAVVEGEVAFTPRQGRPRVLDFLNEAASLLRLTTSEVVHLVAKEHIESLEER